MIYTLYIFDPNGCCIFYKEWARKRHLKMVKEEEFKLMYGLLASIKSFAARISPVDMKEGLQSFATDKYRLHFFESPTSLKFLMMSDLAATSLKDLLNSIYVAYVETVCRNVMVPARGRVIDSQFFMARLEFIVGQSPYFTSKAA